MKRPDYRTLQALDAVIRERGFERAAQKLCPHGALQQIDALD